MEILIVIYLTIAIMTFSSLGGYLIIEGFAKNWYQFTLGLIIVIASIIGYSLCLNYISKEKINESHQEEETIQASWGTRQLNIDNLYEELLNQEVDYPEIVLAQALLETGHFESYSCRERNNLFGLMKKNGTYMSFPHWTYSVTAYKKYIQKYKDTPEDYYKYLDNLGYAGDSSYIEKVKQIQKKHVKDRNSR